MSTTYYGQHSGIVLKSGFAAKNPVTIAADGTITSGAGYNGDAVYGANYPWTLANLGTVESTGSPSDGIALKAGGLVTNGASGMTTALIEGGQAGVYIGGGLGTLVNSSTIYGIDGPGVYLKAGGSITNQSTGLVRGTELNAPGIRVAGAAGTIDNFGTIKGNGILQAGGGINLIAGGTVTNEQGGSISSIYVQHDAGTVDNFGSLGSVLLEGGGDVTNEPSGTMYGIFATDSAASVDNSGSINGYVGSRLAAGGSVLNREAGSITRGISISGATGTVTNYGEIGYGVGGFHPLNGVYLTGSAVALTNFGTIAGHSGFSHGFLRGGGAILHATTLVGNATVTNYGTIEGMGSEGFALQFGSGDNLLLVEPGAVFIGEIDGGSGGRNLAELPSPGGTMTGTALDFIDFSVEVDSGGSWIWAGDATIAATSTLAIDGSLTSTGTLSNSGTVTVTGGLTNNGTLSNAGTITVDGALTDTGTLANAGSIAIAIGAAMRLSGPDARLIADPGAVFSGTIDGAGTTLELAPGVAAGALTGLGVNLVDFASVAVDANARWVFSGTNALGGGSVMLVAGASLQNASGGTLTGSEVVVSATGGAYVANSGLIESTSGVAVSLAAGATLTNAGTISGGGGTAVAFSGIGLLTIDPGAVFVGTVDGDGGSWIELAADSATGTLTKLGRAFTSFGHLVVDTGADWQVSGGPRSALPATNDGTIEVASHRRLFLGKIGQDSGAHGTITLGAGADAEFTAAVNKGQRFVFTADTGTLALDRPVSFRAKIHGFRGGDTIDLVGTAADHVVYSPGHLAISEGGTTFATLRLFGNFATSDFALSSDGRGGTIIALAAGDPRPPPLMLAAPAGDFWTVRR